MTRLSRLALIAAIALCSAYFVNAGEAIAPSAVVAPPYGLTFPAEVVRVVDGDTIDVRVSRVVRIRLLDCWSPETRTRDLAEKAKGLAAKRFLEDLADNRQVKVFVPVEPGKKVGNSFSFGRALGHVWLDGGEVTLSETMVRKGHATKTKNGR